MSYAGQTRDVLKSGAVIRLGMFGQTPGGIPQLGIMDGADNPADTFACYFSSGRAQENLEAMMLFKETNDFVLRVLKTEINFDPTIGKRIILKAANEDGSDLVVLNNEVQTSAINPEWVCGCKKPTG